MRFTAVTGGSKENESFFRYILNGTLIMGVVNEAAVKQFEVGKCYYLDFVPAED